MSSDRPSRATDVAGVRARLNRFSTEEGRSKGLGFVPDPTDVIICTYPKCGTTLMQQIAHGLRTRGDMDFGEITEVVPWIELAQDMGVDLSAPQRAAPNLFKSHLDWTRVPKGARYIYVIRDPRDMVVSFYHFFEGWFFETGSVDLETFALEFVIEGTSSGDYWNHLASWWHKLGAADTLWLCFEDVVSDLRRTVEHVATFIGVDASPDVIDTATEQASIDFMRSRGLQFDDHLTREARNAAAGLPADATTTKVRRGRIGGHRDVLTPAVAAAWERMWKEIVEPATGLASYESLRSTVAARTGA